MNIDKNTKKITIFAKFFLLSMKFQRDISSSQATLPIVCAIAFVMWFVLPSPHGQQEFLGPDYGVWQCLPPFFRDAQYSLLLGVLCGAIAVYMMVELKNRNMLLRVNSYMLSSTLAILLALSAQLHPFQPGSLLMVLIMYAYFPLFASYQMPDTSLTLQTYLPISLASLFFPKILLLVPVYWMLQMYLRAFTFRIFCASVLSLLLPYWFYGGISIITDSLPQFLAHVQAIISVPDFLAEPFPPTDWLHLSLPAFFASPLPVLMLAVLMIVIGIIDFQIYRLHDKTRVRSLYDVIAWHAVLVLAFIMQYRRDVATLLPIVLLDTSILYGHFFTLTRTRFSHILNIVLSLLLLTIVVLQFDDVWRYVDALCSLSL